MMVSIGKTSQAVGAGISRAREAAGLTIVEFSEQLAAAGYPVNTGTLGRIETGEVPVTVDLLVAAAEVLDVDPAGLLR